jgi:hypothetical protein
MVFGDGSPNDPALVRDAVRLLRTMSVETVLIQIGAGSAMANLHDRVVIVPSPDLLVSATLRELGRALGYGHLSGTAASNGGSAGK